MATARAPVRLRLFGLYLVLASAERFLVEFIRRNDEVVAGVTQPQLWAAAMAFVGIALLVRARRPTGAPKTVASTPA